MTTSKLALVFPGQGCQFVGMGKELCEAYAEARAVFERADDVLGSALSRLCFEGPENELNDTANTQPAIYVTTYALWQVLRPRLEPALPQVACVAGHSMGEFSALAVAGAFGFEDGLRLVRCRGEAMRDAGAATPGGMAAILGLEDAAVAEVVAAANEGRPSPGVWVANYNAPGQVVIAGEKEALDRALSLARERKAKRAIPLAVSVPCHTPLMGAAAERLGAALAATTLCRPWAPVVSNVTATPIAEPRAIVAALLRQLTSPVRWVESVQGMVQEGVMAMVEVGPKAVVSGLIGRISPSVALYSVTDVASVRAFNVEALHL